MKNWINDVKLFFERKSNNVSNSNKREKNSIDGIVKERMKYFEELQLANTPRSGATEVSRASKWNSNEFFPDALNTNNMEKTPSMVMNQDNLCIYQSEDGLYGSFKKRPNFMVQDGCEEEEVMMRLKVSEEEHLSVKRYESMLKAPLTQEVVESKYNCERKPSSSTSDDLSHNVVPSLIDKWNQHCLSSKEKENLIDMDLLNSMKTKKLGSRSSIRPVKLLKLLENNRNLKWVDTEKVRSKNLVDQMSREEVIFQESQFELISSEASYYRSLNVLVDKFYNSPLLSLESKHHKNGFTFRIKAHQKEHLFSNILQIHLTSGKFLADLEKAFSESVVMKDLCKIVIKYAKGPFLVYVPYIQNQKFQTEAYNELKKDEDAAKVIEELEGQVECCSLSLDSFLLLPMQRLLRILLLLKTIKKNVPKGYTLSADLVDTALSTVNDIIQRCSAKKDIMDERQRMLEISRSLTFKPGQTNFTISSGTLIHEGEVKCHRKSLGMKNYLSSIRKVVYDSWLILTNEYLLITKITRTKDISYLVEDWCALAELTVMENSPSQLKDSRTSREFHLTFNKINTYTVLTQSKEECVKWINELKIASETAK